MLKATIVVTLLWFFIGISNQDSLLLEDAPKVVEPPPLRFHNPTPDERVQLYGEDIENLEFTEQIKNYTKALDPFIKDNYQNRSLINAHL